MTAVDGLFIGTLVVGLIGGGVLLFFVVRLGDADSRRQLALGELATQRGFSFDAAGSGGVIPEQRELPEACKWVGGYRRLLRWTVGSHEVAVYDAHRNVGEEIQSMNVCLIKRAGRRSPHFLIERDWGAFMSVPSHLKRMNWQHPRLRLLTNGDPAEVAAFLTPAFFERLASYGTEKINMESNGEVLMVHLSRALEPNQLVAFASGVMALMLTEPGPK